MTIGTPEPHRGGYLLVEILAFVFIGIPVGAALVWAVSEAVEHFTP